MMIKSWLTVGSIEQYLSNVNKITTKVCLAQHKEEYLFVIVLFYKFKIYRANKML